VASQIGEKINEKRRELGISLERLAELSDSSKSYLWELENRDKPNPSVEKINKIALALGVSPQYLLEEQATETQEGMVDNAFFRKYQSLDDRDKEKIRKIVDSWWNDGD
jgi:transcriptional regulator with XRE-family HTH domain